MKQKSIAELRADIQRLRADIRRAENDAPDGDRAYGIALLRVALWVAYVKLEQAVQEGNR